MQGPGDCEKPVPGDHALAAICAMNSVDTASINAMPAVRGGPIRWLILGGVLLIAAIALGAVVMAGNFRERALHNAERELENTVLLLARHFDQQLEDFEVVQKDLIDYMRANGVTNAETYKRQMSIEAIHKMLKSKMSALSNVGGLHLFDAEGRLINTSAAWPVPPVTVADRPYFRTFKTEPLRAGDDRRAGVQPHHRRLDHRDRPQGHRQRRRIHRRRRPRHRIRQFREILRLRRARAGRGDFDPPPRRHLARPLSACRRDDRQEFQDRSGQPAAGVRTSALDRSPDQPDRRQGPHHLLAVPQQVSARDRRDHDHGGCAGRLARADHHPGDGRRRLGAGDCHPAVRGGAQAVAAASPVAEPADAGEAAPRHRGRQHDAGPVAVRRRAAPHHLQPALHRDVRAFRRRRQTRLQLPRHRQPPQGNRILHRRRREIRQPGAARHPSSAMPCRSTRPTGASSRW